MARRIGALLFVLTALNSFGESEHWIGTWAASPQHWLLGRLASFENQTVRLIVHTSASGNRVRIRLSNEFGDQPLHVGAAHIARRATGAEIDPSTDRALTFSGKTSTTIAPHATIVSDPTDFDVPALSDLAVSLYFPDIALASTTHSLAKQTNYVSSDPGDSSASAKIANTKTIGNWPFLTGVDVLSPTGVAVVAFGSSLTDGDGSTRDTNHRYPDVLAERLQKCGAFGVLNEGIIGNRLLHDLNSPGQKNGPFSPVLEELGPSLGEAGVKRFQRDVLDQTGVKYVILGLGINDILFPGSFTSAATDRVTAHDIIDADRDLLTRAHKHGIRVIITTLPGHEGSFFPSPTMRFYTPENEKTRQAVNAWIRTTKEFDGMVDFDEVVRDPAQPARIRPDYDSGDHLHPNDAGYTAQANAIPLTIFGCGS